MTALTSCTRFAVDATAMRLDNVREMHAAREWIAGHGVAAVVVEYVLWISAPDGVRMSARLGEWLTLDEWGNFHVFGDEQFHVQHGGMDG